MPVGRIVTHCYLKLELNLFCFMILNKTFWQIQLEDVPPQFSLNYRTLATTSIAENPHVFLPYTSSSVVLFINFNGHFSIYFIYEACRKLHALIQLKNLLVFFQIFLRTQGISREKAVHTKIFSSCFKVLDILFIIKMGTLRDTNSAHDSVLGWTFC